MKILALFFLSLTVIASGGNHNHHDHDHHHDHSHKHKGRSSPHRNHAHHDHGSGKHEHTHSQEDHDSVDDIKIHDALILYSCESFPLKWKQLSSEPKQCPICLASKPNCGKILEVQQRKGVDYKVDELRLPNKRCPVSKQRIEPDIFILYKGKKIFFNNPLNRDLFEKNPAHYLTFLELDSRGLGKHLITHASHLNRQK